MIARAESRSRLITPHSRGSELQLTISPRSAVNQIELASDGSLRVRITAPPVDGAANAALLKILALILKLPRSQLSITSGHTSRHKRLLVTGITPDELELRLRHAIGTAS